MTGKTNAGASKTGAVKESVITVTYPEGSDCTVSNGSRTFRAPDTSGAVAFVVSVGTWTVKATDGSSTKEKSVSITAKGQVETVELAYDLWIIKDGQNVAISGWTNRRGNYDSYSWTGSALMVHYSGTQGSPPRVSSTTNTFNLTNFKMLNVRGWIEDSWSHDSISLAVLDNSFNVVASVAYSAGEGMTTSSPTDRSIDISGLSGDYYIGVTYTCSWVTDPYYAKFYIDQLCLV